MRVLRLAVYLIVALLIIGIVGSMLPAAWAPRRQVIADKFNRQWRAAAALESAMRAGPTGTWSPETWPVALGISLPAIEGVMGVVGGSSIHFDQGSLGGTRVTLESLSLKPGSPVDLNAVVTATAERGNLALEVTARGTAMVTALDPGLDTEHHKIINVTLTVLLDSVEITGMRQLAWFRLRGFWAALVPELAARLGKDQFNFRVAIPAQATVDLSNGIDRQFDVGDAKVDTHVTVSTPTLTQRLSYATVFLGDRLWLVGTFGDSAPPTVPAGPPDKPREELSAELDARLQQFRSRFAELQRSPTDHANIEIVIGRALPDALIAVLTNGGTSPFVVQAKTTRVSAPLLSADTGSGGALGRASAKLSLCNDCGSFALRLEPTLNWNVEGPKLTAHAALVGDARVRVHVDIGPGGGIGNEIALSGASSGSVATSASTKIVGDGDSLAVAVLFSPDCAPLTVEASGSPVASGVTLPGAGLRLTLPPPAGFPPPIVLIDSRPRLLSWPELTAPDGSQLDIPVAGVIVRASPSEATVNESEIRVSADIEFASIARPDGAVSWDRDAAIAGARARVGADAERIAQLARAAARTAVPGGGSCGQPTLVPTLGATDDIGNLLQATPIGVLTNWINQNVARLTPEVLGVPVPVPTPVPVPVPVPGPTPDPVTNTIIHHVFPHW